MKDLETEDKQLRQASAGLTLDKLILQAASWGNFRAPHADVPVSSKSSTSCTFASAAPVEPLDSIPHPEPLKGSKQREVSLSRDEKEGWTADLVALAQRYGRYGYGKTSALLKAAGWFVNDKRADRTGGVRV